MSDENKDQAEKPGAARDPAARTSEGVARQQARRKARLAAELRANLSRRKTQARSKAQTDDGEVG